MIHLMMNFRPLYVPPSGDWILESGVWDDQGLWLDEAIWED